MDPRLWWPSADPVGGSSHPVPRSVDLAARLTTAGALFLLSVGMLGLVAAPGEPFLLVPLAVAGLQLGGAWWLRHRRGRLLLVVSALPSLLLVGVIVADKLRSALTSDGISADDGLLPCLLGLPVIGAACALTPSARRWVADARALRPD